MAKILHCDFRNERNELYHLEIYDSEFSGTSTAVDLDDRGFELTYECDDDRFTGLVPSRVDFGVIVTNSVVGDILKDLRYSDYKRFQLHIRLDGVSQDNWWSGNIINDINSEPDLDYPKVFNLTAICGLSALKNIALNENVNYSKNVLYSLHNYLFNTLLNELGTAHFWSTDDIFFFEETFWLSENMSNSTSQEFLRNTAFYPAAFVEVDEDSGAETWESVYEVLEQICKAFGCRLMLTYRSWWLVQVNAYANSSPNHRFKSYKKFSTTYFTSNNTVSRLSLNNDLIRYDGEYDYLPILRDVSVTYDHIKSYNMLDGQFAIWNDYRDSNDNWIQSTAKYNTPAYPKIVELGDVNTAVGSSLSCAFSFRGSYKNGTYGGSLAVAWANLIGNGIADKVYFYIHLRLKLVGASNTYYFHANTETWTTVDSYPNGEFDTIDGWGNNSDPVNIELVTNEIPENGIVYIESYCVCRHSGGSGTTYGLPPYILDIAETTVAPDINIYLKPLDALQPSYVDYLIDGSKTTEKVYVVENKPNGTIVNSTEKYDVGTLLIGTGPIKSSWGRIRTRNAGIWDDGLSKWRAYDTGDYLDVSSLLVREIMFGQSRGVGVYRGNIRNLNIPSFNYRYAIEFEGKIWVPLKQTYNAVSGSWSGDWFEIADSSFIVNLNDFTFNDIEHPLPSGKSLSYSKNSSSISGSGSTLTSNNWVVNFNTDGGSDAKVVNTSTISIPIASSGFIVPENGILSGFKAVAKSSANNRYELGLFLVSPVAGSTSNFTGTLVAYSDPDVGGGSYQGVSLFSDLSAISIINAGDIIFPAFKSGASSGDTIDASFTIIYKTINK